MGQVNNRGFAVVPNTITAPNRTFNDWTELEQQVKNIDEGTGYTKSEVDALLDAKVDKETNKSLATSTQLQQIESNTNDIATINDTEIPRIDGDISSLDATKADQDSLTEEITNRTNADTAIRTDVNATIAQVNQSITNEAQTREDADDALADSIAQEVTNRTNADTAIRTDVNAAIEQEASARQTKDSELEAAIALKGTQLYEGLGIGINAQNEICAKIDGITIILNSAGLLSVPQSNIVLSVASVDGGFPDSTYMNDDVIDGGYPDTVY